MITIDDIKTANKVRHHHFFDPKTRLFFNSRILPEVYFGPGGVFFVTSEQYMGEARHFKVRHFHPDTGSITTALGHSKGILTKAAAAAAAGDLAAAAAALFMGAEGQNPKFLTLVFLLAGKHTGQQRY